MNDDDVIICPACGFACEGPDQYRQAACLIAHTGQLMRLGNAAHTEQWFWLYSVLEQYAGHDAVMPVGTA